MDWPFSALNALLDPIYDLLVYGQMRVSVWLPFHRLYNSILQIGWFSCRPIGRSYYVYHIYNR